MTREAPLPDPASRIRVAVRYDDFSNGSPDALERFLVETARASSVPMTVAAVPFGWGPADPRGPGVDQGAEAGTRLDPHKIGILSDGLRDGTLELAQHGYDHTAVGRDRAGRPAEFSGQPEAEQRERVARGLELLEDVAGVRPRTFVPPWNRYDAATMAALESLEFTVLSAGREAPEPIGSEGGSGLHHLPATVTPLELRREIVAARKASEPRVIVALLHPYDFVEMRTKWSHMERGQWSELMHWITEQDDVDALALRPLSELEPDLGADRLGAYARYHAGPVRRLIPASWAGSLDRSLGWYPDPRTTRKLAGRRALRAVVLWISVIGISGALGTGLAALVPESSGVRSGLRLALAGAVVALAIRAFAGDGPYFKGILVTVGVAALAVGFWLV